MSPVARSFISLLVSLGTAAPEPGLLPSPSIILIPKAKLSNIGLGQYEEDGDGSGWRLCIEIDSGRRVWFPPRPFDGGTPTNLVGGVEVGTQDLTGYGELGLNNRFDIADTNRDVLWCEIWVIESRNDQITGIPAHRGILTCMDHAITFVHLIQVQQHPIHDLPNQRHGDPIILMSLYQTEQILAENLEERPCRREHHLGLHVWNDRGRR